MYSINFLFTHVEHVYGHNLKRDIANIEGRELLTGVINEMEELLYGNSLWILKVKISKLLYK